jgi:protein-S-isoprenylcysteine O-methyltransferase Ste14
MKFARNAFLATLVYTLVLFLAAGRLDYPQGWIYLVVTLATTVANVLTIADNADLRSERARPGEGIKSWDRSLLGLSFLVSLATIVLAGLDSGRFRLSPQLPRGVYALGILLMIAGQAVFLAARRENRFFSTVMRIQTERGHVVCKTGPYAVIRHPGYLGMILSTIGLPFLLGSLWSTIPAFVAVVLLIVRTALEDRTLVDELEGYLEYTKQTRYRLLPWIW